MRDYNKVFLHRASYFFFLLSFNNHKSGNNQVWRNKQVQNPVEWNQATTQHNSEWARWPWLCLHLFTSRLNSEKTLWGRTDPHLPFHPCWSTNWNDAYTFQNVPRFCCNPRINIPRQLWFSCKCRSNTFFSCKMWFMERETVYSKLSFSNHLPYAWN